MEEARNSRFSIVCLYAFIRYNMSLPNTSVANLFLDLIFDDGVNSRCSLVSLRCSLKPLWQFKRRQPSQWSHITGLSFSVISSWCNLGLTYSGLDVILQFFLAIHNVLERIYLVMSVKNIMEFQVTLNRMTIKEHASECSVGKGTIQHNIVYGETSFA